MFRRVLAAVVVVAVAAVLFVLAWPQFFGLQQTFGIAQVISLRTAAALIAVALIVGLTLLALLARPARRFFATLAVLLVAFALVNAAVLSTRGFGDTAFETAGDSTLTVLSWNTLGDVPGAGAVADLALENDVDILTLPESTEAFSLEVAALMKAAGRPMWVETVAFDQVSKSRSTSVLWTADLGTYTVDETVGQTATLPTVVLRPDDGSGRDLRRRERADGGRLQRDARPHERARGVGDHDARRLRGRGAGDRQRGRGHLADDRAAAARLADRPRHGHRELARLGHAGRAGSGRGGERPPPDHRAVRAGRITPGASALFRFATPPNGSWTRPLLPANIGSGALQQAGRKDVAVLASEVLVAPSATAAEEPAADTWQPVSATAHIAQARPVDSFLSILPEDANGTVRGARRSTWRR
jgi:hypothetical protein